MNTFNRFITVLLLVAVLLVALGIAMFPTTTIGVTERSLNNLKAALGELENSRPVLYGAARIGVVVGALLLLGSLVWAEVIGPRRSRAIRVQTEGRGRATVAPDSVARRLAWHIDQIADVIAVRPRITAHGQAVNVKLDLETSPDIDVRMKTDEVVAATREVLADHMGLQVGQVQVQIRHAPYQEKG